MNIRILSYNIHKGTGWATLPSTLHRMQHQIQKLGSDIIFLQEVRGSQFESFITEFCPHSSYGKNAVYQKGHHGNAIISKFPILYSENIDISMHRFERRGLLHSAIQLPDEHIVHLFCTHLGLFGKHRREQLDAIVEYINHNISDDQPIILGGDFNDWSGYATQPLIKTLSLQEAFLHMHRTYAKTYPSLMPALKLDRLYFRGFQVNYANLLTEKTWKYLSDHIAIDVSLNLYTDAN